MRIEEVADQCLYETGARGFKNAREVALVGLALVPDGEVDRRAFRRQIKDAYTKAHSQERGFVLMAILLPFLISIVANWIVKWIWDHHHKSRSEIRAEACAALCGLAPAWMDILTSTNIPPSNRTELQP